MMKWKHLRTKLQKKLIPRGVTFEFAKDQGKVPPAEITVNVKVARWYMPIFLFRETKKAGFSFGWRLAVLYLYYTQRRTKAVN